MSRLLTIARRELGSLFGSPVAWVVGALYAAGAGLVFLAGFGAAEPATLRTVFEASVWLAVFGVPAVCMRALSEELSRGTIERLMTLPVAEWELVVGKWLGLLGFLVTLALPLAAQVLLLEMYAEPPYGATLAAAVGLLLVVALFAAITLAVSATTENQVIAFGGSVFVISVLTFVLYFLPDAEFIPLRLGQAARYANVNARFAGFARGVIALPDLVFFVSLTAAFLFVAVRLLESRRWR